MRSALCSSILASALLPGVSALPLAHHDGDSCYVVVTTHYVTVDPVPTHTSSDETPYPLPTVIHSTSVPPDSETPYPIPTPDPDDTPYPLPTVTHSTETSIPPYPTDHPTDPTDVPTDESTSEPVPEPTPTPTPEPATCRPAWDNTGKAPSTGPLRAALIFVDFPDSPADQFGQSTEDLYAPLKSQPADLYSQMSYGKLEFEIVPLLDQFYRMPNDSVSYGFADDDGMTGEEHGRYINDALAAVGDSFSFQGIDVLFIASPNGTEEINRSASYSNAVTAPDGSEFTAGNVITYGNDLYPEGEWQTVNHETGHAMGLPDLYPYSPGGNALFVGGFDMMGLVWGQSPDLFAWHKWRLNWIEDGDVNCVAENGVTTHRLSPIEVAGGTKAIAIPVNATGYVMAEVRSKQGANSEACDEGTGVLLYTTDSALGSGDGPVRVIDTKPETSGCGSEDNGALLNDAPLTDVGGEPFDTELGVKIRIVGQEGDDYIVEVEREV
ncbi:M6 metalloprotease [Trematosphaeria pertusa]|uniref:M6 metalloprotease n=1 Tax=Trematosphaeria pertusa TaxID=390896 RepID=A0A6A6IBX7_9PLEO|nr:M6 metalloprotease [Trematosphaeria pertusa]KAF2248075.1 M6 metalloprotease [Trematosphaeria pertusa]